MPFRPFRRGRKPKPPQKPEKKKKGGGNPLSPKELAHFQKMWRETGELPHGPGDGVFTKEQLDEIGKGKNGIQITRDGKTPYQSWVAAHIKGPSRMPQKEQAERNAFLERKKAEREGT